MARITVEDCMSKVDNIFDMILLAAKRAKRIANGADALVERENDKPTVIALREIAEGKVVIKGEIAKNLESIPKEPALETTDLL